MQRLRHNHYWRIVTIAAVLFEMCLAAGHVHLGSNRSHTEYASQQTYEQVRLALLWLSKQSHHDHSDHTHAKHDRRPHDAPDDDCSTCWILAAAGALTLQDPIAEPLPPTVQREPGQFSPVDQALLNVPTKNFPRGPPFTIVHNAT